MFVNHPHVNRPNNVMPVEDIVPPKTRGNFHLNEVVIKQLPIPGTRVISSLAYGRSLWGECAKITTGLPDGTTKNYFLKVSFWDNSNWVLCYLLTQHKVIAGPKASIISEGEFESIQALNYVMPSLAPTPWTRGKYIDEESYFMLMDFREVGKQPPDPAIFAARLAELHKKSVSPTGKFGFHTTTCHGTTTQITDV
ncbi:hypothetical protein GX51_04743 [Blastomyces parvus]|uniref:Protein-ribulosamine 3-kinase n=1 Tax=Blastomyces parvus TaxID=2060905 RepID=A0A2B7X0Q0_9EURO|nr:hypothetical protein GX51_04743 [Blastomyces parvus]